MGEERIAEAHRRTTDAAVRVEELAALRLRLVSGERLTDEDVDLARRRAQESRVDAAQAHEHAAQAHRAAAEAHLAAARALEATGHADLAATHRAAARQDFDGEQRDLSRVDERDLSRADRRDETIKRQAAGGPADDGNR